MEYEANLHHKKKSDVNRLVPTVQTGISKQVQNSVWFTKGTQSIKQTTPASLNTMKSPTFTNVKCSWAKTIPAIVACPPPHVKREDTPSSYARWTTV